MIAVGGAPGADCGCGAAQPGVGPMSYVGHGQGSYILENGYKYVGFGGDHGRTRRDFTCIICLSSLLLLIPLLLWLLWPRPDWCDTGYEMCRMAWDMRQQDDCCSRRGLCCAPPPVMGIMVTPQTPVPGPVDPFNCAIDLDQWRTDWSAEKMTWCCSHHNSGCEGNGVEGPAVATYDCNSGFENFVKGWSSHKKYYCCVNFQKGCDGDMSKDQARGAGFGAGAQHGTGWAPIAPIS